VSSRVAHRFLCMRMHVVTGGWWGGVTLPPLPHSADPEHRKGLAGAGAAR